MKEPNETTHILQKCPMKNNFTAQNRVGFLGKQTLSIWKERGAQWEWYDSCCVSLEP